jgi:hypothetical protein
MKFTVRHIFNTDIDTYWSKIFFDREYNQRLFVDALSFPVYEVLELTEEPNGVRRRKVRTEPKADAPAVVTKLIGDSIGYVEEGVFDPAARRWAYKVTTSKLSDKIQIAGSFWVEPRGEHKIERICEIDCNVKIFGVGGAIEGFIEKSTRDTYEKATAFTNKYIAEKGLLTAPAAPRPRARRGAAHRARSASSTAATSAGRGASKRTRSPVIGWTNPSTAACSAWCPSPSPSARSQASFGGFP